MPSRTTTRPLLVLCAALMAAALGWWWMHGRATSNPRPGSTLAGRTAVATPSAPLSTGPRDVDAVATNSKGPSRPLPPDDAPLADVFDELKARADAGDAHAACRLAVDLLDCDAVERRATQQLRGLRLIETASDRKGDLTTANRYAELQTQVFAARERCARIDAGQIAMAGDYLRRSAKAGVPEAMVRYAAGQGFGSGSALSALRDPNFDAWRREAPAMMQTALRDGRPAAVAMLSEAYRNDDAPLFAALIPNDAVQARAYFLLQQRLLGKSAPANLAQPSPDVVAKMKAAGIDTSAMSPTPEQMRQAGVEADRLYQAYFAGQPVADKRVMQRWLDVGARLSNADRSPEPLRCN